MATKVTVGNLLWAHTSLIDLLKLPKERFVPSTTDQSVGYLVLEREPRFGWCMYRITTPRGSWSALFRGLTTKEAYEYLMGAIDGASGYIGGYKDSPL